MQITWEDPTLCQLKFQKAARLYRVPLMPGRTWPSRPLSVSLGRYLSNLLEACRDKVREPYVDTPMGFVQNLDCRHLRTEFQRQTGVVIFKPGVPTQESDDFVGHSVGFAHDCERGLLYFEDVSMADANCICPEIFICLRKRRHVLSGTRELDKPEVFLISSHL